MSVRSQPPNRRLKLSALGANGFSGPLTSGVLAFRL